MRSLERLRDELFEDVLGYGQAINLPAPQVEVLGRHGAGNIERNNNIDTAGFDGGFALNQLRAGQADDEKREDDPAHGSKHFCRRPGADFGHRFDQLHGGIKEGGFLASFTAPPRQKWQEQKEEQKIWMRQGHGVLLISGWGAGGGDTLAVAGAEDASAS